MEEQRVTDTEGVVTNITYEEGPAGPSVAHEAGASPPPEASAAPTAGALVYVLNAGGDPKTLRVVALDKDGNAVGHALGRQVVRDDGSLAFEPLSAQVAEERNVNEIARLEERLRGLRGEG